MDHARSTRISAVTALSEEDDLIGELEKLKTFSESSVAVDSTVDDKINIEARRRLLQNLYLIDNKLRSELARGNLVPLDKPLVRSHLSNQKPHNLIQEVELSNARLTTPFLVKGPEAIGIVDNKFDRTLIFDARASYQLVWNN